MKKYLLLTILIFSQLSQAQVFLNCAHTSQKKQMHIEVGVDQIFVTTRNITSQQTVEDTGQLISEINGQSVYRLDQSGSLVYIGGSSIHSVSPRTFIQVDQDLYNCIRGGI